MFNGSYLNHISRGQDLINDCDVRELVYMAVIYKDWQRKEISHK